MADGALDGRYELHERIGAGGMGAVYRATDTRDGTDVAVKVIRPEVSSETGTERFAREAKHTASVRHPHVVEVLDSGVSGEGELYLVMELLDGMSLEERLEMLPPPTVVEVVDWITEALEGLSVVHAAGIIHRDLKPGNLFLARDGTQTVVKVLDFGLARSVATGADGKPLPSLTQTHQFLGTPYYMSPEQVRSAKHIDQRADLFSVGVILYEALAGRRPFDGPSASAVIAAIVADEPIDLADQRPDLPPALLAVVRRALSRKPDERFADADEMRLAVSAAKKGSEALRVTPRDVSATAPTDYDDSPRRPPLSGPVPKEPKSSMSASLGVAGLLVSLVALGAGAYYLFPGQPDGDADAGAVGAAQLDASDATTEAETDGPHRVAGPDDLAQLAARLRTVPEDPARGGVRFIEAEGGWIAIALGDVSASAARRMAARMGAEAVPYAGSLEYALTPALYHTSVSLNMRGSPDPRGVLVRTLPRGAVVVGLSGRMEGTESQMGESGAWMYVVASQRQLGWSAARFLERDAGCLPTVEDVVGALSVSEPNDLYEDTVISRARFRRDDIGFDGFLSISRDPNRGRSVVSVLRSDAACALSPELVVPVSGWVVDVLMSETDASGGESLVLIAWQRGPEPTRDGVETWTGHRLSDARPVFEATLPSSQHLPRGRRASLSVRLQHDATGQPGYYPVRIRHVDGRREFFRWEENRLMPVVPEDGTEPGEDG